MTDADREIVERLQKYYSYSDTTVVVVMIDAADLIKSQAAKIERLEKTGLKLEHALDAIDIALMPEVQREADTKTVGGPVSPYSVDYDERAAVQRVQAFVKAQAERIEDLEIWQQRALPWLPKCGTSCQCQGEHDCELKVLRREAVHEGAA